MALITYAGPCILRGPPGGFLKMTGEGPHPPPQDNGLSKERCVILRCDPATSGRTRWRPPQDDG